MPSFVEYHNRVIGLLSPSTTVTSEAQLINGLMGLNGEAGEAADIYKKARFHEGELDKRKLALELGDALFYVTSTADSIGYTLEDIALMNMEKLAKRYPRGAFNAQDSREKKDEGIPQADGDAGS